MMYPNILLTGKVKAVKFIFCLTFYDTHTQLTSQQTIHFVSFELKGIFNFQSRFKFTTSLSCLFDVGCLLDCTITGVKGARTAWLLCDTFDVRDIESFFDYLLDSSEFAKMVQEYVSPVRVHKYPFEMVMAVSTTTLVYRSLFWRFFFINNSCYYSVEPQYGKVTNYLKVFRLWNECYMNTALPQNRIVLPLARLMINEVFKVLWLPRIFLIRTCTTYLPPIKICVLNWNAEVNILGAHFYVEFSHLLSRYSYYYTIHFSLLQ